MEQTTNEKHVESMQNEPSPDNQEIVETSKTGRQILACVTGIDDGYLGCLNGLYRIHLIGISIAVIKGTLASLSMGFHAGWPSPSLAKLLAEDSDLSITFADGGWIVIMYMMGWLCGSSLSSVLVDMYGRKTLLLSASILHFVGCHVIIFAHNYWWLYLARFVIGFGSGITIVSLLMYIGEIAEDRIRGTIAAVMNCMVPTGIMIAYCMGPRVDRATLAAIGAAIPVIFAMSFCWMPESPHFSVMKNEPKKALKNLVWLRGTTDADEALSKITQDVEFRKNNVAGYKDLVTMPENRKALIIGIGMVAAQEFSGIAAILAYSQLIFKASGAKLDSSTSILIVSVTQFLGGFLSLFTVKLAERRTLLLSSTFTMILFLSGEALYFQLRDAGVDVSCIFWLPVIAIIGVVISYSIGVGVFTPAILSDIFPCSVKSKSVMLSANCYALFSLIATAFYQVIAETRGIQYAFWFFAGCSVCSGIFIYLCVPKCPGGSAYDLQDILENGTNSESVSPKSEEAPVT